MKTFARLPLARDSRKTVAKNPMTKTCRHCDQTKPIEDFPAHARTLDGLSSWCRRCHNAACRRSREKRREREAVTLSEARIAVSAEMRNARRAWQERQERLREAGRSPRPAAGEPGRHGSLA